MDVFRLLLLISMPIRIVMVTEDINVCTNNPLNFHYTRLWLITMSILIAVVIVYIDEQKEES